MYHVFNVLLNRKVPSASRFPNTKKCVQKKESLLENISIMNNARSHNKVLIKSGCHFYYWSIRLLCSALSPVLYVPLLLMLFSVFCTRQFIWHIMCLSGMEAPELVQAELQPYVFLFITLSWGSSGLQYMPLILCQVPTSTILFASWALSAPIIFCQKVVSHHPEAHYSFFWTFVFAAVIFLKFWIILSWKVWLPDLMWLQKIKL